MENFSGSNEFTLSKPISRIYLTQPNDNGIMKV